MRLTFFSPIAALSLAAATCFWAGPVSASDLCEPRRELVVCSSPAAIAFGELALRADPDELELLAVISRSGRDPFDVAGHASIVARAMVRRGVTDLAIRHLRLATDAVRVGKDWISMADALVSLAGLRHALGDAEAGWALNPGVIAWPDFVSIDDRAMILGRFARGLASIDRAEAARAKFELAEREALSVPLSVADAGLESDRFLVMANLLVWADEAGLADTAARLKSRLAEMFDTLPEARTSWPKNLSDIVE